MAHMTHRLPRSRHRRILVAGGQDLKSIVNGNPNLIASWGHQETNGTNLAAFPDTAMDGTHSGSLVGVPGNGRGIRYAVRDDGATTHTDIYSVALNTALNTSQGSLVVWPRVSGAGVWTDGTERRILELLVDGSNFFIIRKAVANNQIDAIINFGGTTKAIANTAYSPIDMFMVTMTWDTVADEYKVYFDAVQEGVTQNGLGVWVGNLSVGNSVIGAGSTAPTNVWDGDRTEVSLYGAALTQSEITAQYQAGN